jgi:Ca2+/H+ antiporter
MYVQYLVFQLITHADQFAGESAEGEHVEEPMLSTVGAVGVLCVCVCV